MRVTKLSLKNFRNYREETISFSPFTNVIYGDNAQGKTNILEAVNLFCRGKSHRTKSDTELVRFTEPFAFVQMEFADRWREFTGAIRIDKNGKKAVKINEVSIGKLSRLMSYFNVVLFSPEDLMLVKGSPAKRRSFMDAAISQLHPAYLVSLTAYQKALEQKNSLLKTMRRNGAKEDPTLSVWNDALAREGAKIMRARQAFLESMDRFASRIQQEISGERLRLFYEPGIGREGAVDEREFFEYLESHVAREIELAASQYGIQRDDFDVQINDNRARVYGSQGQQRTAALSLKIAQAEHINEMKEEFPVLLLDDIMSELDTGRRSYLSEKIKDKQVLITCTDADILPLSSSAAFIRVENGTAVRAD